MRLVRTAGIVAVALVAVAGSAHADEDTVSYEVVGTAELAEDDSRAAALDRSFAVGVEKALAVVADRKTRKTHRKKLYSEVIRRARLYIASYKVVDTFKSEGVLNLTVTVHVDLAKLRERLTELGIDSSAEDLPPPDEGERPTIALLMHSDIGGTVSVTFGDKGDNGPAARALFDAIAASGFELDDARGAEVPVTREADEGLPLSDTAARAMASELGAGGVVIVGLQAREAGAIRGTQLVGATAALRVRILDTATGDVLSNETLEGASFAPELATALDAAALDAIAGAKRHAAAALARQWPKALVPTDAIVVRVRGFVAWSNIDAIVAQLEKTRGVDRVWTRGFSQSQVELGVVTDLSSKRVASAVAKTRTDYIKVDAKKRDKHRVNATVRDR